MSKLAKKKRSPVKAKKAKPALPARDPKEEAKDIERAVYDGMQDLRVKKSR